MTSSDAAFTYLKCLTLAVNDDDARAAIARRLKELEPLPMTQATRQELHVMIMSTLQSWDPQIDTMAAKKQQVETLLGHNVTWGFVGFLFSWYFHTADANKMQLLLRYYEALLDSSTPAEAVDRIAVIVMEEDPVDVFGAHHGHSREAATSFAEGYVTGKWPTVKQSCALCMRNAKMTGKATKPCPGGCGNAWYCSTACQQQDAACHKCKE